MNTTVAFDALMTPYTRLARANMELWARFMTNPALAAQGLSELQHLWSRSGASATDVVQSNAWTDLVSGLMRNAVEFWSDAGKVGLTMFDPDQVARQGLGARRSSA